MDGTFAYGQSMDNIKRSLNHDRKVEIYFVYQDPVQAWEFTKKREALEHRKVSKEVFIKAFFEAQKNANEAKKTFGKEIELNIVLKNNDNIIEHLYLNVKKLDPYIKNMYSANDLERILI